MVTFCLRKPCLNISCLSLSTDSAFSFLFRVPFLLASALPDPHARPLSLLSCLLGFAGVSLPSHALSLPCRTRQRKAASAQSSRSGGEGGSVLVGMERTASTGESGRRPCCTLPGCHGLGPPGPRPGCTASVQSRGRPRWKRPFAVSRLAPQTI